MECREVQELLNAFHDGELPDDGQGWPSAGAGRDAPGSNASADGQGRPSAGTGRDATGSAVPADGQGRPSAGAGRDAPGSVAPADGQGRPSAGAGREAPGSVAPARARVEEHLRGCPECSALLSDLARADRAAGVPDPGPAYWDRFNARVMDRVTQAADGQGWPSAGAGRDATGSNASADGQGWPSAGAGKDAPGFEAPTGPRVAVLRPKHGWMRQQLRYLVPAAAAAALVVMVVRYGGMYPAAPAPTVPSAVSEPAAGSSGQRIAKAEPETDGQGRPSAGAGRDATGSVAPARPTKKAENPQFVRRVPDESTRAVESPAAPSPSIEKERFAAVSRDERDRMVDRSISAGNEEASRNRAAAPAAISVPSPPGMQAERKKMAASADGQGWPSAGTGRDATGSVAPTDVPPCALARTLAAKKRWREAEAAQRRCLAQDRSATVQEKGLVFLAELLDRQARFGEADAVITEVDRRFPESRPLDLYRQQRPMVQKRPE